MRLTDELSPFQTSAGKHSRMEGLMAIDTFTQREVYLYQIIQQALVKHIQYAFLSPLKPKEQARIAHRLHQVALFLSDRNQCIIDFKQRLYAFISDSIGLTDSRINNIIEFHIKEIAPILVQRIKSSTTDLFNEELMSLIELQDILVLPSENIEDDKSSLPADCRVFYSVERKQRRYDSLARLLSMRSELSVCTAVTILNDELIISANCSRSGDSERIIETIHRKINIIRQAIAEASAKRDLMSSYEFHQKHIQSLRLNGGLFQPDFILIKALSKLIQTTLTLEETPSTSDNFSPEEINALLTSPNVTCLIPYEQEDNNQFIHGIAIYDGLLNKNKCPFAISYPNADISYFHAEQLIAFYLRTIKKLTLLEVSEGAPAFHLGLSKLCCLTCSVLTNFSQLRLRGSSGDLFANTVNLFASEYNPTIKLPRSPDQKNAKKLKAYADSSPSSPDDRLDYGGKMGSATGISSLFRPDSLSRPQSENSSVTPFKMMFF